MKKCLFRRWFLTEIYSVTRLLNLEVIHMIIASCTMDKHISMTWNDDEEDENIVSFSQINKIEKDNPIRLTILI